MRKVELQIDLYLLLQVDDWSGIDKHECHVVPQREKNKG